MRDFAAFLDKTAAAMGEESLAIMLVDCIKFRDQSREHGDYNTATVFDIMISHINAEIARRVKVSPA